MFIAMKFTNKNPGLTADSLVVLYNRFQFTQIMLNTYFFSVCLFVCRVFCSDVHFTFSAKADCLFDKSDTIYLLHLQPSSAMLECIVLD